MFIRTKIDLVLNKLQCLICHKIKLKQTSHKNLWNIYFLLKQIHQDEISFLLLSPFICDDASNIEQDLEGSTQQSSRFTATYQPSRKLSKLDEPDMQDTAGEVGMISSAMYSCGPLNIDEQKKDDQLEPIYSSFAPIQGRSPEDLLEAMDDRERWRERVRDICADCVTWWWWGWYVCNILHGK